MTPYLVLVPIVLVLGMLLLHTRVPLLFDWRETDTGLEFVVITRIVVRRVPYSEMRRVGRLRTPLDFAEGLTSVTLANRLFAGTIFVETHSGRRFQFTPAKADDFVIRVQAAAAHAQNSSSAFTEK
jgi:hypothetical protein